MLNLKALSYRNRASLNSSGFSLLEVAVVMLIMSLLLGGLLMSISATQDINSRTDAEAMLNDIKEALYGYAQATGRLPCPATATSNGLEAPVGGGVCTQRHGFVPSVTLGLSGEFNDDNLLMDKWLSPYRYSVASNQGSAFTTPNGIRNTGMAVLNPNLRVCTLAPPPCGAAVVDRVPVVLISLGADWSTFNGADVEETENSGEATINGYRHGNDRNFVLVPYIEDNFDDLLTWISPSILYTRMISAGQLP